VAFRANVTEEALGQFVDWLAGRRPSAIRPRGEGLELLEPGAGDELNDGNEGSRLVERLPELKLPLEVQAKALEVMDHVLAEARAGRHFDFAEVTRLVRFAAEAARSGGAQLLAATQVPRESPGALDHSVNVFLISTAMMAPLASDPRQLELFGQAALLHDVGKSVVPQEIAEKKGPLTLDEERILRRHCEFGAKLLARNPHVDPVAIEVAYCHHMRDDGHGYPRPILPIEPGPVSNMVQVGDMFDLVAEARPAQRPLSTDEALDRILRTPGMRSKRDLLRHFLHRATSSPPGSEVVLESGERAIVVDVFPDAPAHPRVRVVKDRDGRPVADPYLLDLREAGLDTRPVAQIFLKPR
jgi:putative nucleotidyltransferase with HDIG domain